MARLTNLGDLLCMDDADSSFFQSWTSPDLQSRLASHSKHVESPCEIALVDMKRQVPEGISLKYQNARGHWITCPIYRTIHPTLITHASHFDKLVSFDGSIVSLSDLLATRHIECPKDYPVHVTIQSCIVPLIETSYASIIAQRNGNAYQLFHSSTMVLTCTLLGTSIHWPGERVSDLYHCYYETARPWEVQLSVEDDDECSMVVFEVPIRRVQSTYLHVLLRDDTGTVTDTKRIRVLYSWTAPQVCQHVATQLGCEPSDVSFGLAFPWYCMLPTDDTLSIDEMFALDESFNHKGRLMGCIRWPIRTVADVLPDLYQHPLTIRVSFAYPDMPQRTVHSCLSSLSFNVSEFADQLESELETGRFAVSRIVFETPGFEDGFRILKDIAGIDWDHDVIQLDVSFYDKDTGDGGEDEDDDALSMGLYHTDSESESALERVDDLKPTPRKCPFAFSNGILRSGSISVGLTLGLWSALQCSHWDIDSMSSMELDPTRPVTATIQMIELTPDSLNPSSYVSTLVSHASRMLGTFSTPSDSTLETAASVAMAMSDA